MKMPKTTKTIVWDYRRARNDTSNPQQYLDNLLRIESKRWWSEEEIKKVTERCYCGSGEGSFVSKTKKGKQLCVYCFIRKELGIKKELL